MKILVDTSVIVEIDRHNKRIASLLKRLVERGDELIISTVTVAEILTGARLRRDADQATKKAKEILNQFIWCNADGDAAEVAAYLYSGLYATHNENSIEFQDVLIGATALSVHADVILTLNKKDFLLLSPVQHRVRTPEEFEKKGR